MSHARDVNSPETKAKQVLHELQADIIEKARNHAYLINAVAIDYKAEGKKSEELLVSRRIRNILDMMESANRGEVSYLETLMRIKEKTKPYAIKVEISKPKDHQILPRTLHLYIEDNAIKCRVKKNQIIEEWNVTKALNQLDFTQLESDVAYIDIIKRKVSHPSVGLLSFHEKNLILQAASKEKYHHPLSGLLSSHFQKQEKITFIGDSTMDNKIWLRGGVRLNALREKLGIRQPKLSEKIHKHSELSVIENMAALMPDRAICDYTNDGFTTTDCLRGEKRNKVFDSHFPNTFPAEFFSPLRDGAQDIKGSSHIVLSVGGNNIREFLQRAASMKDDVLKNALTDILKTLKEEYLEIVAKIRKLNPNAKIILMTQYYPSASQNDYKIYPFMKKIGPVLGLGTNPNNAMDVAHALFKKTYADILSSIKDDNIVVADVTSSLNPFDANNHAMQIEPSGTGGSKIAKMLQHVIEDKAAKNCVYRFLPSFFTHSKEKEKYIEKTDFNTWSPRHPHEFTGKANYDVTKTIEWIEAKQFDPYFKLSSEEKAAVLNNETFQKALIVLFQTDKDKLVSYTHFKKLEANPSLQQTLAAAHGYLNSGNFGWFKAHGQHGRNETYAFVRSVITDDSPENLQARMTDWLKTSNTHNSSRAYYAAACGFFGSRIDKDRYVSGSKADREEILQTMRCSRK